MKKTILLLAVLTFFSCKNEKKEKSIISKNKLVAKVEESHQDVYGSWVGDFLALEYSSDEGSESMHVNKINVLLKKIINDSVYGQSIVAGNVRPFRGVVSKKGEELTFLVAEPGDDKDDGKFEFKIIGDTLSGIWTANSKSKEVIKRGYKLARQEFKYNPTAMLPKAVDYVDYYASRTETQEFTNDDGTVETYSEEAYRTASSVISTLNASTTKLSEKDLKNLKKLELEIIRNTIFARHGYSFKKKTYRQFFDPIDWYVPVSNNVDADLSDLEKENIALLKRFEKYAVDNYDTFGR